MGLFAPTFIQSAPYNKGYIVTGSGVVSGGSGTTASGLAGSYQSAYDEARQANEQRYQEILAGYAARRAAMEGWGQQAGLDIDSSYRRTGASVQQGLVSSGLAGTTVAPTMAMGVERERLAARARVGEQVQDRLAQLEADKLLFMERRTDSYPDYNQMANLATGLGRYGGNGGSSYYGGGYRSGGGTMIDEAYGSGDWISQSQDYAAAQKAKYGASKTFGEGLGGVYGSYSGFVAPTGGSTRVPVQGGTWAGRSRTSKLPGGGIYY